MNEIVSTLRRVMTPGHIQFDTITSMLVALTMTSILTAIAAKFYLKYYRGLGRPQNTAMTMILVGTVTSAVIMGIGSNLALSLGMVGALSIVRYRTPVKDMRDLAYLFWSIVIGLCCGAGSFRLATIMTVFVSALVMLLEWMRLHHRDFQEYILILHTEPTVNVGNFSKSFSLKLEPKSTIYSKASGSQEMTFVVRIAQDQERSKLEEELKGFQGIRDYQLLSPNHEIVG